MDGRDSPGGKNEIVSNFFGPDLRCPLSDGEEGFVEEWMPLQSDDRARMTRINHVDSLCIAFALSSAQKQPTRFRSNHELRRLNEDRATTKTRPLSPEYDGRIVFQSADRGDILCSFSLLQIQEKFLHGFGQFLRVPPEDHSIGSSREEFRSRLRL